MLLDPLAGLGAHGFANADPVLELLGCDNAQNFHPAAGFLGADRGKTQRVEELGAVVHDYQKFTHIFGLRV